MSDQAPWWQSGIIYQIYPRSFQDSNGDGVGDLPGIESRLDYLSWLGVDAIWISPIYPSPMADFGYDVSDFTDIHPVFGTMDDFDRLVARAHDRGIRVLLDYVPNHTSDQHPWFLESRASRHGPKRDWYIWRDPLPDGSPPNNWVSHFGGSAWEYDEPSGQFYLHSFLREQPDLNWRCPEVRAEMLEVLRFWCERGVDGFRVDVLYQIIKDDQFRDDPLNPDWIPDSGPHNRLSHVFSMDRPEVHDVVAEMRAVLDRFEDRALIAEVWLPLERLVTYYGVDGNGTHLPLNFQLIQLPWDPMAIRRGIGVYEELLPRGGWPNWVIGNHDVHRIASRVGHAQARVAALLLLMLRGTPTMYYGDEIGMTNVPIPPSQVHDPFEKRVPGLGLGRDPQRTPMQWDGSPHAGFSISTPWLPLSEDYARCNVAESRQDPASLLSLYATLINLRRTEPALRLGEYHEHPCADGVIAWTRSSPDKEFLIAANLTHGPATLELCGRSGTLRLTTELDGRADRIEESLTIPGNQGVIIEMDVGEV